MKNQTGQVIIILLLIILVSLTVGLAIVQNSLTDVSTSTKTEQSSRAFSAAEAGLESALYSPAPVINTGDLGNQSSANVTVSTNLPGTGQALEYPPISKADFAQFWLANPTDLVTGNYAAQSFTIYFGNCDVLPCPADSDKPAIEVSVVTLSGGIYIFTRYFYDSTNTRISPNNFNYSAGNCSTNPGQTIPNTSSKYYCKVTVPPTGAYSGTPYLTRVRILYSNSPQKVALYPNGGVGGSLPPQAATYQSRGTAGDSVRELKVFQEKRVVPYFFDFAIFSNTDITK